MGLTIHYKLRSRVTTLKGAREKMSAFREAIAGLGFEQLSDIFHMEGAAADFEKRGRHVSALTDQVDKIEDETKRWFLIQSSTQVKDPSDRSRSYIQPPYEVVGFSTWPGDGCEAANFGLSRYPETIKVNGREILTGLKGWSWRSFCKTQYASDPECGGVANFVKCHLQVVAALDIAKKLNLLGHVHDEGGYWEKRDVQALAKEVGEWNEMIAALGGALSDALKESGGTLLAPILERGDFERLETEGLKDPKIKRMAEMIRLTATKATGRAV